MASRRRRGGKRNKPNAHWDVDLKQLEQSMNGMDPNSREFKGTADVFMAARWQTVQTLQDADDNSDHLLDMGEWIAFWLSRERGDHQIESEEVCRKIFTVLLDKKKRGRVTMTDVEKFGKMCQRTWRELSSRGLGAALKKYSWFETVVHEVVDEPEPEAKTEERNLEKENAELTAIVEELEETCDDLRNQVNRSDDSIEDLQGQIDNLKNQLEEKDKQIAEQKEEIDRLVTEMCEGQAAFAEELKRTRDHMAEQAAAQQAKDAEHERQLAELRQELAQALEDGKIPDLFCNIPGHTDALAELEQLRRQLEEACTMIAELEQEKEGFREQIQGLEDSCADKDKRIAELEAKLREAQEAMAQQKEEHDKEKQELKDRIAELEPLVGELERAKETINEKDQLIEELKNLLAQKDDHIQQAKALNNDLQNANDKLGEELAALKHELAEKNEEIAALSSSSGDATNQLEGIIARRDDEIAELTRQLEAMKHQLQHSRDEMRELEKAKNAELRAKDDEIRALKEQLENQKIMNDSLQAEIRRLQDTLARMNQSSEENQSVVVSLEQTILDLRSQIAEYRQETIILTARIKESESMDQGRSLQEFEKEISYRDGRIAELERQLERAQSRMKRASVMVQHCQTVAASQDKDRELAQIREELSEAVNKADEAKKTRDMQAHRQNAVLWRQLGAKTVANETLQKRIKELEKLLEMSETRRDQLDDVYNKQMEELRSHLTLQREESRGARMARDAEVESLKRQRDTLSQEKEDLRLYHETKVGEILDKLKRHKEHCAKYHGVEMQDRVSQVRVNVITTEESRESKASEATIPSIPEPLDESEPSGPEQKVSDSMTITDAEKEAINLSILDLERVLVEGNYKIGVLPSEIFCCGIMCCGADWYCCSRPSGSTQSSKSHGGQ